MWHNQQMDPKITDYDLFSEDNSLSSDLGWMLQSTQVDDTALLQALVHEEYRDIYQLSAFLMGDATLGIEAAQQALVSAILNRHRYWGEASLKAWLYKLVYKDCQKMLGKNNLSRGGLHAGVDREMAEELRFLDQRQLLVMFLRYGLWLDMAQIGYIIDLKPEVVGSSLSALRLELEDRLGVDKENSSKQAPAVQHLQIRVKIHSAADGQLEAQEVDALKDHLKECVECRSVAERLSALEIRLKRFFGAIWPAPSLSESAQQALVAEIGEKLQLKGKIWNRSLSTKEVGLVVIIVALVVILGWAARLMASDSQPGAMSGDPQVTRMVYLPGSMAPIPDTGKIPWKLRKSYGGDFQSWNQRSPGIPKTDALDFNILGIQVSSSSSPTS